jgi:ATP-dependent Clp protease ATP-binding subunit ClpC
MQVLQQLKVDPHDVRGAVHARLGSPPHRAPPVRGLTPAAKKAIHLSAEEAQRMQHRFVGTEHILLGLMRQRDGIAARVLAELSGVDLAEFRRRVVRALEH